MNQTLLFADNFIDRIKIAISFIRKGKGIIILDDKNRENEGDLIFSAETMTVKQMALTIRHGSGIVCLCITKERQIQLDLPMMVEKNSSKFHTPFTVTIEASEGVTTGVSAADRITTIRKAIATDAKPKDLSKPGHVFPLVARKNGVFQRMGHTEASIDIMRMSGLMPFGVICELMNDDGTMSRLPEIISFAKKYTFPILTIKDIKNFRKKIEKIF
ncbi:3,4-dihydroxy-2-butanone 4-phosphate synthase [Candidatus Riesia sp. GBBU]|nr:3,4-dihydroxy-2-butanone 4-phosphate synthase [Candidatus Riesia sp. GBBU]